MFTWPFVDHIGGWITGLFDSIRDCCVQLHTE